MATVRPKSPRQPQQPGTTTTPVKDDSIWGKIGTLGRKKRIKEVQEVQAEGKYAIDSPGLPTAPVIPPEEYELEENEERLMIDRSAYENPKFHQLMQVLIEWINDELASQRIIVQNLAEDLYDGQVLQKLLEKLTNSRLDAPEVTQNEEGQLHKLHVVLREFNQILGVEHGQKQQKRLWSVDAIHSKNLVAMMHLLVALARHFRPPVRLPEHLTVPVVIVQKVNGQISHRIQQEVVTGAYGGDVGGRRPERDAFDTLLEAAPHQPHQLQVVKKSMVTFANRHLNRIHLDVADVETHFHDGVYLILLLGLLEGFFVPLHCFHLTPKDHDQKVHNVQFAFELMEDIGLQRPISVRPEDIVNMDLKSTLRVLYYLFNNYKHL